MVCFPHWARCVRLRCDNVPSFAERLAVRKRFWLIRTAPSHIGTAGTYHFWSETCRGYHLWSSSISSRWSSRIGCVAVAAAAVARAVALAVAGVAAAASGAVAILFPSSNRFTNTQTLCSQKSVAHLAPLSLGSQLRSALGFLNRFEEHRKSESVLDGFAGPLRSHGN